MFSTARAERKIFKSKLYDSGGHTWIETKNLLKSIKNP